MRLKLRRGPPAGGRQGDESKADERRRQHHAKENAKVEGQACDCSRHDVRWPTSLGSKPDLRRVTCWSWLSSNGMRSIGIIRPVGSFVP
jgi:hypothetical protein